MIDPELIAAAIFKVMQYQRGMDALLVLFQEENRARAAIELRLLSVFCRCYACQLSFPTEDEHRAIMKEFFSFFPDQSGDYFGLPFNDVKPKLEDRLEKYSGAVKHPHELGPAWSIGKVFAELCGHENDAIAAYVGGLWFTGEFCATKEALDKIISESR